MEGPPNSSSTPSSARLQPSNTQSNLQGGVPKDLKAHRDHHHQETQREAVRPRAETCASLVFKIPLCTHPRPHPSGAHLWGSPGTPSRVWESPSDIPRGHAESLRKYLPAGLCDRRQARDRPRSAQGPAGRQPHTATLARTAFKQMGTKCQGRTDRRSSFLEKETLVRILRAMLKTVFIS